MGLIEDLAREELALREREIMLKLRDEQLIKDLGFRNAHPFYNYQIEFIKSRNKMNLLVAANQVGKTSSGICRCCEHMFTTDEERMELWPDGKYVPGRDKLLLWYFYPDYSTATTAFKTAWQKYLPKGIYLTDEKLKERYGWKEHYGDKGKISEVTFRDGLLQFKAYNQSSLNLQMASVYEATLDEELPFRHYSEITSRMNYTEGYFNMVFTATLGEPEWYKAMEKQGESDELFPNARKWNVSLWDCMTYANGNPSIWTKEKIIATSNKYGTPEEVERRINGRFIVDSRTLVYSAFHSDLVIEQYKIPRDWEIYCGIDLGKGGINHKSAIAFIAVNPNKKEAIMFASWREDMLPTEPIDVLVKYREMVRQMPKCPVTFYDHSAKDFKKVVDEDGVFNMFKADKSQDSGIGLLNSLMKNNMLKFFNSGDVPKIFQEFRLVKTSQEKRHRRDDLCFTKGHKVATMFGFKDVSDIKVGDYVLTRSGFKKVIATMCREAEVEDYVKEGFEFRCTPSHKMITKKSERKEIQYLTQRDSLIRLNIWKYLKTTIIELKRLYLMESSLEDILILKKEHIGFITHHLHFIRKMVLEHCTKRFGKRPTEIFRMVIAYTMLMEILLIIGSKILSAWVIDYTGLTIQRVGIKKILKKAKRLLIKSEILLKNGTLLKKEESGTLNMVENVGKGKSLLKKFAKTVVKHIKQDITEFLNTVLTSVGLLCTEKQKCSMKKEHVLSVQKNIKFQNIQHQTHARQNVERRKEKVYNFTVEEVHEYFCNYNLSANCDAVRFAAMAVDWNWDDVDSKNLIHVENGIQKQIEDDTYNQYIPERTIEAKRKFLKNKDQESYELDDEFDDFNDNVFNF